MHYKGTFLSTDMYITHIHPVNHSYKSYGPYLQELNFFSFRIIIIKQKDILNDTPGECFSQNINNKKMLKPHYLLRDKNKNLELNN